MLINIGGIDLDVPDEQGEQIKSVLDSHESIKKELEELKAKQDSGGSEDPEKLMGRIDALESQLKTQREQFHREVSDRTDLERKASRYLGADYSYADKSNRAIMEAVISIADKDYQVKDKSDDRIAGYFDMLLNAEQQYADSFHPAGSQYFDSAMSAAWNAGGQEGSSQQGQQDQRNDGQAQQVHDSYEPTPYEILLENRQARNDSTYGTRNGRRAFSQRNDGLRPGQYTRENAMKQNQKPINGGVARGAV